MTEDGKMEFWKSLARLNDDCLALKETTTKLADVAQAHHRIAEAHERRVDHLPVVQQWLAERERARETGEQA